MRIANNIMAMNTQRQLGMVQNGAAKSMEKLSSGLRINRAADDAAGLSISEKMRGQIRGLQQASRNAQDGVSFVQTAEGALNEVGSMLIRMKELNVQSKNGTYDTDDQANITAELDELQTEIGRIISDTKFNGQNVFGAMSIAISDDGTTTIDITAASTVALTATDLTAVEDAIKSVNTDRAALGAIQNRLESVIRNIDNSVENLQAAESRIRDVDMAKEIMTFTKNNILSQSATAMLAQANQAPLGVLQLLR